MVAWASEYPFTSRHLEVEGGRMHYVDEGAGPPLLMLHGNPTWSFYYRHLIRAFSRTHRVIAPDHLGAGLSDKPQDFAYSLEAHIANVDRLIAHLGLDRLSLVVHDWGGAIGMGWAVDHAERVERLVVFNTAAFPSEHIPFSIDLCRIPGFGALAIRGLNAFARVALIRAVAHQDRLTPAVRAGYLGPYDSWANRIGNLRFVQDIPMSKSHPSHARLAAIGDALPRLAEHPMLIVWGAKDFCFDDAFLGEWKARFPRASVHYLEDAAHYVVEDAHERIVPLMEAFLA